MLNNNKAFYFKGVSYMKYENTLFKFHKIVTGSIYSNNLWIENIITEQEDLDFAGESTHKLLDKSKEMEQRLYKFRYKYSRKYSRQSKGKVNTVLTVSSDEGVFEIFTKLSWEERFRLNSKMNNGNFYKNFFKIWSNVL